MGKRLALLAFAASMLASPVMAAGIGKGEGEIGFDFAGYTRFDSNTTDEGGGVFKFRGGYHFTDLVQLEGEIAVSLTDDAGADILLTRQMINLVLNFHPTKTVVPYVLFGVGQARLSFDFLFADIHDTGPAFQAAFGSRFFFGKKDRVAVRVEGSVLTEETFDETSTHWLANVGFTWTLGQRG